MLHVTGNIVKHGFFYPIAKLNGRQLIENVQTQNFMGTKLDGFRVYDIESILCSHVICCYLL